MEQVYIDAVRKATLELFSTMMSLDLSPGEVLENTSSLDGKIAITGMIGMAGAYKGNIAIHFPKQLALKSISAMLGMDFDELTDDTKDAIGEISNIVAGGAKTELSASGIDFDLSLPTVIAGENYSVFLNEQDSQKKTILPFSLAGETMLVEVDIKKAE